MKEFIDKLIERLEKEIEYQHKKADEADKRVNLELISVSKARRKNAQCFDIAIQIIKSLAEEYKGGWIACERELPKKKIWVLVTRKSGVVDMEMLSAKGWITNIDKVIAWMPLPTPFKEGE